MDWQTQSSKCKHNQGNNKQNRKNKEPNHHVLPILAFLDDRHKGIAVASQLGNTFCMKPRQFAFVLLARLPLYRLSQSDQIVLVLVCQST